jgi:hypothetical protein
MKSKRDPALFDTNRVSDHRVARRRPYTFADTIRESNREHLGPRLRESEEGPCE